MILMALEMEFRGPFTEMKANALGMVPWNLNWKGFQQARQENEGLLLDETHVCFQCKRCDRLCKLRTQHLSFQQPSRFYMAVVFLLGVGRRWIESGEARA